MRICRVLGAKGSRCVLDWFDSDPPHIDIGIMDFGYDIPDFDPDDYDNYNYD